MTDHRKEPAHAPGHRPPELADTPLFAVVRALLTLAIVGTLLLMLH